MPSPRISGRTIIALCALVTAACTVGPNYTRPDAVTPEAWKELPPTKTAQPSDQQPRGPWWSAFNDPTLDALERDAEAANQDLRVAEANYRQAQAAVAVARAGLFPALNGTVDATRAGGGRGGSSNTNGNFSGGGRGPVNAFQLGAAANWEVDLWGRVRKSVEASGDLAQASAADLENVRLSIQAQVAQNYLTLRVTDAAQRVLQETVAAYERSLTLTQNRYNAGVAARAEVVQAETQLLGARASLVDIRATRAQFEHAVAILTGRPPANVTISTTETMPPIPDVPVSLPSQLLERRPDIAGAERRVAAANAQIGVANAAFFPAISLSANGGSAASTLGGLFSAPALFWSLGASLAQLLFDAGLRKAQLEGTVAQYDAAVATYRQTVLTAFQEVEDQLATLRVLEEEAAVQREQVRAARESVELTTNQYRAGLVSFINVVAVQASLFAAQRSDLDLQNRRYVAAVTLVRALGGGFDAATLASAH
ncbi:MAG TPA: efflux transporter outer membrane subunit [Casimicrobiaceae bacterium]|nr:efflux transporter outer membrane subunit [Casimicrobiaceae bacterium]